MQPIIVALSVKERMLALREKLLNEGFLAKNIHLQIIRAIATLSNDNNSPKIQLTELQKSNNSAQASVPGQILIQKNDGFAFTAARIGFRKTGTLAEVPNMLTFTYADKAFFAGAGELDCIQGFYSAGKVSMNVSGNPVMQPLALSYFENEATVVNSATSGPVYGDHAKFEKFTPILAGDRILDGGTENRLEFDLQGSVDAIGTNNYLIVELLGWQLHNEGSKAADKAKVQNACI